jgi:phospholipid-binding lipoprotein MlaA
VSISRSRRLCVLLAACATALVIDGCATAQKPDPLEPVNRQVFKFNEGVDKYVLVPTATAYRDVVPSPARTAIDNFFNNIKDAWSAVNLVLQGRLEDAGNDFMRFSLNSLMGLGGFIDWAGELGMERHNEDFGQTLGVWGVSAGAYIVWPLIGPSTVRDSIGLPIDLKASPDQLVNNIPLRNSLAAVRVINTRAGLLSATRILDEISLDKYTFVRDAYLQRRRSLIYEGNPPEEGGSDESRPPREEPAAPAGAASTPGGAASAPAQPASAPAPAEPASAAQGDR